MGVSTNAEISYGIIFEEDFEFPWTDGEDNDIDNWWLYTVNGYKHPFEIYDDKGMRIEGIDEARKDAYYEEMRTFENAHPRSYAGRSLPTRQKRGTSERDTAL